MSTKLIAPCEFHSGVKSYVLFEARGYVEVHPQSVQTILAACEDPATISNVIIQNKCGSSTNRSNDFGKCFIRKSRLKRSLC